MQKTMWDFNQEATEDQLCSLFYGKDKSLNDFYRKERGKPGIKFG